MPPLCILVGIVILDDLVGEVHIMLVEVFSENNFNFGLWHQKAFPFSFESIDPPFHLDLNPPCILV